MNQQPDFDLGTRSPGRSPPARAVRGSPDPPQSSGGEFSLLRLINVLLKRWKVVTGLPLVAAVVAAIVSLLLPAYFTARASFVPETGRAGLVLPAGLAGIASQFGVGSPGDAESPMFYASILKSRTLLDRILMTEFPDPRNAGSARSVPLLDLLLVTASSDQERLEPGRRLLSNLVSVRTDRETAVVTVDVETRYPELSAQVANKFLELLNRFNLETRRSSAAEGRRFTEERLHEAETELAVAEDNLKSFLEQNRVFTGSPELEFQHDQLRRQVSILEEVYTTLRRQYEESRILEVRDTPVITIIDQAVIPQERSRPLRKLNVILTFLLAGVVAVFLAFGAEFVERERATNPSDVTEFALHWDGVKRGLLAFMPRRVRSRG